MTAPRHVKQGLPVAVPIDRGVAASKKARTIMGNTASNRTLYRTRVTARERFKTAGRGTALARFRMALIWLLVTLVLIQPSTADIISLETRGDPLAEIDQVRVYEASYRDLVEILYETLRRTAPADELTPVEVPGIGYEWRVGKARCRYRFVPTQGFEAHGRTVVGYFVDFAISGGLPLDSIFDLKAAAGGVVTKCLSVYESIIEKLDTTLWGTWVTGASAVGPFDDVQWRVKPDLPRIIDEVWKSNESGEQAR